MSATWLGLPARRRPTEDFPTAARRAVADSQLRRNLRKATTTIRAKRSRVVGELADWEQLRQAGKAIKDRVLSSLDDSRYAGIPSRSVRASKIGRAHV